MSRWCRRLSVRAPAGPTVPTGPRSSITTANVTALAARARQDRVALGQVEPGGVTLHDGNTAGTVDFKSSDRVQAEDITRDQLHVYALGYQELTGENADLVEVLNLDDKSASKREVVNKKLLVDIRAKIQDAGSDLRANQLPRLPSWCTTCERCDMVSLCRNRAANGPSVAGVVATLPWPRDHGAAG
jgi:hypothetical protein